MKKNNVLQLDGGGSKILYTYEILDILDNFLRKFNTSMYDYFDSFAGNSAGALVICTICLQKDSI